MSRLHVDLNLVQKYNVAGPRYTSYPPATRFSEDLAAARVDEELQRSNATRRDLSLYFHLPFCRSLCWYCGCTTVITTRQSDSATYLNYLRSELDQMAAKIDPKRKVTQLHFGGGTPTFLTPQELRALGEMIRARFNFADDLEAGVEIDPRRLTRDHLSALREIGFNRASVGVQDFNPLTQVAVHRIQPRELTERVIECTRQAGFKSINIDLIYGLPCQTVESFDQTLEAVLEMTPDRIAIFSYAHVPWIKPAQKILEQRDLPSPETRLQLLKHSVEKLTEGEEYIYIGMDHFARPDDELAIAQRHGRLQRNFQGYSTRGGTDIISFGMSAISQTSGAYWQNQKELPAYYEALDRGELPLVRGCLVTPDDQVRRATIMELMCNGGVRFETMSARLGIDFADYFSSELESLGDFEEDGLGRRLNDGVEITRSGRLFIRNIAMRFDAYLPKDGAPRFSRTI